MGTNKRVYYHQVHTKLAGNLVKTFVLFFKTSSLCTCTNAPILIAVTDTYPRRIIFAVSVPQFSLKLS